MSEVRQYRKKPAVIEAIRLNNDQMEAIKIAKWCGGYVSSDSDADGKNMTHYVAVKTLEGTMLGSPGDYIIKGVKSEFYPCKPDIFEQTYEAV